MTHVPLGVREGSGVIEKDPIILRRTAVVAPGEDQHLRAVEIWVLRGRESISGLVSFG